MKRRTGRASSPEHQQDLRQMIITAAREQFRRHGYEGVSMRKVASLVGYTAGAIYRYFPDKESLLRHIWEDELRWNSAYVRGAVDQAKQPIDKVRQIFLAYLRYWLQHADNFRVVYSGSPAEVTREDARHETFGFNYSTDDYNGFKAILEGVIKDAPNAPRNIDMAMQALLAGVHGVVAMKLSPSQFPWFDAEKMGRLIVDSMLAGWGVRTAGVERRIKQTDHNLALQKQ
jgi:AcrR family transcriptional regulator